MLKPQLLPQPAHAASHKWWSYGPTTFTLPLTTCRMSEQVLIKIVVLTFSLKKIENAKTTTFRHNLLTWPVLNGGVKVMSLQLYHSWLIPRVICDKSCGPSTIKINKRNHFNYISLYYVISCPMTLRHIFSSFLL